MHEAGLSIRADVKAVQWFGSEGVSWQSRYGGEDSAYRKGLTLRLQLMKISPSTIVP